MKRWLKNILIILVLLPPCGEIAARIMGWGPAEYSEYKVEAEPSNWLVGDERMGIRLNPGTYEVTLNDHVKFKTTHSQYFTRGEVELTPQIVPVFGCSFTYGYGVNDNETFVSVLNENYDSISLLNMGVPGYGTVQAMQLLGQFELASWRARQEAVPLVVYVYSKVHPERNSLDNSYRSALKIGFNNSNRNVESNMENAQFPYIVNESLQYAPWDSLYNNWPGRSTFAIVNALQSSLQEKNDTETQLEVTRYLLDILDRACERKGWRVVFVNLDDPDFENRYGDIIKHGKVVHVGFDFEDESITNRPYDSHPNRAGHQKIAEKISLVIKDELEKGR